MSKVEKVGIKPKYKYKSGDEVNINGMGKGTIKKVGEYIPQEGFYRYYVEINGKTERLGEGWFVEEVVVTETPVEAPVAVKKIVPKVIFTLSDEPVTEKPKVAKKQPLEKIVVTETSVVAPVADRIVAKVIFTLSDEPVIEKPKVADQPIISMAQYQQQAAQYQQQIQQLYLAKHRKICDKPLSYDDNIYGKQTTFDHTRIFITPFMSEFKEEIVDNVLTACKNVTRNGSVERGFIHTNKTGLTDLRFLDNDEHIYALRYMDGINNMSLAETGILVECINMVIASNRKYTAKPITAKLASYIKKLQNENMVWNNESGAYLDEEQHCVIYWITDPMTCLKFAMKALLPGNPPSPPDEHHPSEFNVGDCVKVLSNPQYSVMSPAPRNSFGTIKSLKERYRREPFHYYVYTVSFDGKYDEGEYIAISLENASADKCTIHHDVDSELWRFTAGTILNDTI